MEQTKKEDEKSFILKHKLQYTAESPIYAKRCKILMNQSNIHLLELYIIGNVAKLPPLTSKCFEVGFLASFLNNFLFSLNMSTNV